MKLTEKQIEAIQDELVPINIEEMYLDMLREVYGDVNVCGLTMDSGEILQKLDPIAFTEGMHNYVDGLLVDNEIVEVGVDYYWLNQVNDLLEYLEESAS